ncbi:hypothetical protein F5X99DRAFT_409782 [Biscogniauxia marginata]|nr:hypothetical protein F5X99DRAFT_409782 [Biscogniauxia marginata]
MWDELVERKFGGPDRKGTGPPGGREDSDQILQALGAVASDTPAIAFSKELIEEYPEAKVVLVERKIESWYNSFVHAVIELRLMPKERLLEFALADGWEPLCKFLGKPTYLN